MDTNTPRDKSADVEHVEKLWKKRFALDASTLEKAQFYLKTPDEWASVDGSESYFCKNAPALTISIESDNRNGYEYYLFNQMDKRPLGIMRCKNSFALHFDSYFHIAICLYHTGFVFLFRVHICCTATQANP